MPLNTKPVPMPEKKVTFKTVNKTVYAYYTLRAYRNEKGKPTSDVAAIGKKDPVSGMLIPNRRYFELFQGSENLAGEKNAAEKTKAVPVRAASYGSAYSLLEAAEETGLRKTLENSFPGKWRAMLAAAMYMLCEGNVMMYIEDWFDETETPFAERLDDQQCSRMFASISYRERSNFFKEWIKRRIELEYIAYDITSVSTYSKGTDIAEWGYNRDGEKLAQINIGMFYGMESRLPVYYEMYNGSIPDKSRLAFMMKSAEKMGISNARFVMDRGFVTEENLVFMNGGGFLFLTALSGHLTEAKRIIDGCKDSIRKSANRISEFGVYAAPADTDIYGFKMRAHVYFDLGKQALDEKELYAHIESLQAGLEKLNKNGGLTRKHKDYFIISKGNAEKISFVPDNDKIDESLSYAGFYILLSNDLNLSSRDALKLYRAKDAIEKNFDQMKNGLDFKRMRTHVNKTADGKMFVGFLALVMRSYLLDKIKGCKALRHLTLDKALLELRKIKAVTFDDSSRLLMPLTKLQKDILEAIGIPYEKLIKSFV